MSRANDWPSRPVAVKEAHLRIEPDRTWQGRGPRRGQQRITGRTTRRSYCRAAGGETALERRTSPSAERIRSSKAEKYHLAASPSEPRASSSVIGRSSSLSIFPRRRMAPSIRSETTRSGVIAPRPLEHRCGRWRSWRNDVSRENRRPLMGHWSCDVGHGGARTLPDWGPSTRARNRPFLVRKDMPTPCWPQRPLRTGCNRRCRNRRCRRGYGSATRSRVCFWRRDHHAGAFAGPSTSPWLVT